MEGGKGEQEGEELEQLELELELEQWERVLILEQQVSSWEGPLGGPAGPETTSSAPPAGTTQVLLPQRPSLVQLVRVLVQKVGVVAVVVGVVAPPPPSRL